MRLDGALNGALLVTLIAILQEDGTLSWHADCLPHCMLISIPQEDGTLSVVKCAIDPVWFLPGIAERFKLEEAKLRQNLFEQVRSTSLDCMLMTSLIAC